MCNEIAVKAKQYQHADGKEDGDDEHKDDVKATHARLLVTNVLPTRQAYYSYGCCGYPG